MRENISDIMISFHISTLQKRLNWLLFLYVIILLILLMFRVKVRPHDATLLHETGRPVSQGALHLAVSWCCKRYQQCWIRVRTAALGQGAIHYQFLLATYGDFFLTVFSLLAHFLDNIITLFWEIQLLNIVFTVCSKYTYVKDCYIFNYIYFILKFWCSL